MASLFSVGEDGIAVRGWPTVRVNISPTRAGCHWSVAQVNFRGENKYVTAIASGRVAAGPDLSVREAFEAAWYEAMMSVPEIS